MRRVWLNLLAFGILSGGLVLWGMMNFLQVGPLKPATTTVIANFEASPGLQPGFPVTYLGIQVGKVGDIQLAPGRVRITLELEPAQDVPRDVTATVRRRSVVGEPYVALEPIREGDLSVLFGQPDVDPEIALEHTRVLVSYEELFESVDRLLAQIPADDLNIVIRELSLALEGQVETARGMITDLEGVSTTFAANTDVIEGLAREVSSLTSLIADRADVIVQGLDNSAVLTRTLRENMGAIERLLASSPSVLARTTDLLVDVEPVLQCVLRSAASIGHQTDPRAGEWVRQVIEMSPTFQAILRSVQTDRDGDVWLRVRVLLDQEVGPHDTLPHPTVQPPAECELPPAGAVATTRGPGGTSASVEGVSHDGDVTPAGSGGMAPPTAGTPETDDQDLLALVPPDDPTRAAPGAVAGIVAAVQLLVLLGIARIRRRSAGAGPVGA